jgi:hypothetical protein
MEEHRDAGLSGNKADRHAEPSAKAHDCLGLNALHLLLRDAPHDPCLPETPGPLDGLPRWWCKRHRIDL